jgi:hypothetical protein
MSVVREVLAQGWRIRLDLAPQVLRLDIAEPMDLGRGREPVLARTLPRDGGFVSAAALLLKAKQFDDGLYAAVELAAQAGMGHFGSKAGLLVTLAETMASRTAVADAEVRSLIFGACQLGSLPVQTPADVQGIVRTKIDEFLDDELRSKPLGFYTWNPELESLFRQDRLLQSQLPPGSQAAFQRALDQAPGARTAYEGYLRLTARLTNPPADPAPLDAGTEQPLFPPSRSHEVDLFHRLYGDREIPDDFNLADELIRRIALGDIRLAPTEQSGWYDYQTWSLEPLVLLHRMPEARHLRIGKRYRRHLLDLFKGTLALTRETHVRQGGGGRGGGSFLLPVPSSCPHRSLRCWRPCRAAPSDAGRPATLQPR